VQQGKIFTGCELHANQLQRHVTGDM